ncbi:MAG: hypothetical protein Q7S63_00685 [bacterium]|nr:hypothetical protein [bacterium]
MTTITIPKEVTGGRELVLVPRKDYERVLRVLGQIRPQAKIDRFLKQALREVKQGKTVGPFRSVEVLKKSLEG